MARTRPPDGSSACCGTTRRQASCVTPMPVTTWHFNAPRTMASTYLQSPDDTSMLTLTPGQVSLSQLRSIATQFTAIGLPPASKLEVDAATRTVASIVAAGKPAYGINTGFGLLARIHIRSEEHTS